MSGGRPERSRAHCSNAGWTLTLAIDSWGWWCPGPAASCHTRGREKGGHRHRPYLTRSDRGRKCLRSRRPRNYAKGEPEPHTAIVIPAGFETEQSDLEHRRYSYLLHEGPLRWPPSRIRPAVFEGSTSFAPTSHPRTTAAITADFRGVRRRFKGSRAVSGDTSKPCSIRQAAQTLTYA